MGTYLHPRTEDPRKLERLAGVSSGVYERLAEQEKAVKAVTDALMSEFQCSVWEVDRSLLRVRWEGLQLPRHLMLK